ncbi:MAG: ester cyclase [Chloroflexota bacterium]
MSSIEHNKRVARRYFEEVVNYWNAASLEEVVSAELRAQLEPRLKMRHKAVPDWQVTIEHQIAEDDLVVTTGTTRGTHSGEWFTPLGTIAPTGKHFAFTFTSTMRVRDGKLCEIVWSNWDWLELLQQLGEIGRPVEVED